MIDVADIACWPYITRTCIANGCIEFTLYVKHSTFVNVQNSDTLRINDSLYVVVGMPPYWSFETQIFVDDTAFRYHVTIRVRPVGLEDL